MILTITMNPAIDIQYRILDFKSGSIFRASPPQKTAGGKGLNVSRVLSQLGSSVTASGVLGGDSGQWIRKQLKYSPIRDEFIEIASDTRECLAIIGNGSQTEILGSGTVVTEKEITKFLKHFKDIIKDYSVICISGSLPSGIPRDFYNTLLVIAREYNKKVILDTSGPSLKEALREKPFLIKPNREELEAILNTSIDSLDDIIEAATTLRKLGAENVLVSLGSDGALFIGEKTYLLEIPSINVSNPVGSGDATVAGMAYGISSALPIEDCLRYSMACGLSNTMNEGTGEVILKDVDEFKDKVNLKRM